MIHLGHKTVALEKKGIQTKRGNYNREIKRRNQTRATLMEANYHMWKEQHEAMIQDMKQLQQQQREIVQILGHVVGANKDDTKIDDETIPNELLTKLKTAKRINESLQENPNTK